MQPPAAQVEGTRGQRHKGQEANNIPHTQTHSRETQGKSTKTRLRKNVKLLGTAKPPKKKIHCIHRTKPLPSKSPLLKAPKGSETRSTPKPPSPANRRKRNKNKGDEQMTTDDGEKETMCCARKDPCSGCTLRKCCESPPSSTPSSRWNKT